MSARRKRQNGERRLEGRTIAILATDGFEESELMQPKEALEHAGAQVEIVSPRGGEIRGWKEKDWSDTRVPVDVELAAAEPERYDALMLPGGTLNADMLRINPQAVVLAKSLVDAGKPVAAICHAPWLLVEAEALKGLRLTSWPSLKTDICNAGGVWVDEPVVTDGNLVTSRKPDDLPMFCEAMVECFSHPRDIPPAGEKLSIGAGDAT